MILLIHKNGAVIRVIDLENNRLIDNTMKKPIDALFYMANKYKERLLVWCQDSLESSFNIEGLKESFYLKNMMLSYSQNQYLPKQIGYVDGAPFLKVGKKVKYPTWFMSSQIGAIHASQLLKFKKQINLNESFDFVLNSIAKIGISKGLFCYSEPRLINDISSNNEEKASIYQLFKFVKFHYKGVWSFLLLINFIINERRIPLLPFLRTIFIKKINPSLNFDLELIKEELISVNSTVDIIIPTLGRKEHVYNFLTDLSNQSQIPNQVIIVEQNGDTNSKSDLGFISNKTWAFKIIHKFIHQTGACNARNLALEHVSSDYVFFADDDIRVKPSFIETTLKTMNRLRFQAVTLSCLRENDIKKLDKTMQWIAFGSGCSFVKRSCLKDMLFDMKYEFGFGEDIDFGMQLRNKGTDVIYLPEPEIIHIKAPIGGFRSKINYPWNNDVLQPKPSPTVMLNKLENTTKWQLLGYKTTLFLQFYKSQNIKNPIKYLSRYKKQWRVSEIWANKLKEMEK
ncbi:glycosyltransferase [Flavivirga abyssicola]|uniref:glycosyltransferase family 2 protein n=1 Tax=Flavivirga abyssicola TaxID=3063533 RepID=UPI0026DFCBD2|nr:glycosyltransferase [Flavivirga sp. MEBiC07777]WVK13628.1 glycosyltransferase [Flavivirga sp. MEBiC07777]